MNVFARIINLESRPDRWDMMQAYVRASKLDLQRFSAVKMTSFEQALPLLSLRARADIRRERVQHQAISGLGAVGCAVSHFSVWSEFLASSADFCLVLEDDVHPRHAPDLDVLVDMMLKRKEWDIGLLGWCSTLPGRREDGSIIPFPSSDGFVGAQAYMLTRHAAEVLMKHLFPLEMQVDYALQAIADAHGLRIVPSTGRKIRQKLTGSDVFRLCLLCEPQYVYAVIGLLIFLVAFSSWKFMCR